MRRMWRCRIFVNPTEFAKEDFQKYPRPIESDLAKRESAGVDFVLIPRPNETYPANDPEISVDLPNLSGVLEGRFRPGHFKGVCQVVAKLFNIFQPDAACFGQKDDQQFRILGAMGQALNWPIEIVRCPTIRDPDGLARAAATNIFRSPNASA